MNNPAAMMAMSATPIGAPIVAASKGAKYGSYLVFLCCFISFVIFIGTLIGSLTDKDEGKKKTLQGVWIAFLVLMICSLLVGLFLRSKSSPSKIVSSAVY